MPLPLKRELKQARPARVSYKALPASLPCLNAVMLSQAQYPPE